MKSRSIPQNFLLTSLAFELTFLIKIRLNYSIPFLSSSFLLCTLYMIKHSYFLSLKNFADGSILWSRTQVMVSRGFFNVNCQWTRLAEKSPSGETY